MKFGTKWLTRLGISSFYIYNESTCEYEKANITRTILGLSLLLALVAFILIQTFFNTPKERLQAEEISVLKQELITQTKLNNYMYSEVNRLLDDNIKIFTNLGFTLNLDSIKVEDDYFIPEMELKVDSVYAMIEDKERSMEQAREKVEDNLDKLKFMPSISPIRLNEFEKKSERKPAKWSSGFGNRFHPLHRKPTMHNGLDISVRVGADVLATADGFVSNVGYDMGYGRFVEISHGPSISNIYFKTRYAHLSGVMDKKSIRIGKRVVRGQVIARSGASGAATGPHLHYEVMSKTGQFLDPLNFMFDSIEDIDEISDIIKDKPVSLHY